MPALLEDPTSPVVYRSSGQEPFPTSANPQIPSSIFPRPVTLRDRVTIATLIPFFSPDAVPARLLSYLCDNLNKEIEDGNTYPMKNPLPLDTFGPYWFGNFGAVMVLGDIGGIEAVNDMERNGADWNKLCLGSFYVKPNYPGRSSHICNGGFLVTAAARNKGVGKSMGQCYLDWAPQLGYTYSVFNIVYETNTASTRIWDSLGFKRIGRVPACGILKSYSDPVDGIIYGRDLKSEEGTVGNEERFDKIRYYLRHSLYPQGADRSEKSRLRSAATHYKLIPAHDGVAEKLMLKDKEVISDPQAQYDIAKQIHLQSHGGINKTTAVIATKFHWVRIKETVSHVIKNCPDCKDTNKPPVLRGDGTRASRSKTLDSQNGAPDVSQHSTPPLPSSSRKDSQRSQENGLDDIKLDEDVAERSLSDRVPEQTPTDLHRDSLPDGLQSSHISSGNFKPDHMSDHLSEHISPDDYRSIQQQINLPEGGLSHDALQNAESDMLSYDEMAIDPQIMEQFQAQIAAADEYDQQQNPFLHSGPHHSLPHFNDSGPQHLSQHQELHPEPTGLPFNDVPHLHTTSNHEQHDFSHHQAPNHNDFGPRPPSRYISPNQHQHNMMGHPAPDDHIMGGQSDDGGGGGGGMNNMRQIRHVLPMEYISSHPEGTDPFNQPRQ